jgi:hypothetical protein
MVNYLTHDASFLQAPDYRFSLDVTDVGTGPYAKNKEYHGNVGSYFRLADFFDHLRTEGVYDNTRIILVSDHGPGYNYVSKHYPGVPNIDNFNPILMVKDFSAHGSLKTDDTFMTNADTPFLALTGLVDTIVNPNTGTELSADSIAAAKSGSLFVSVSSGFSLPSPNATTQAINSPGDYYVHDNIFDPNNWEKAEK